MTSNGALANGDAGFRGELFHVGMRVPDLEAAMSELADGLGLDWAAVVEREQPAWTPEGGATVIGLRFTYSRGEPQHVELLAGERDTIWDGTGVQGIHHQGYWVEDVAAETDRLVALGWTLVMAQRPPNRGTDQ